MEEQTDHASAIISAVQENDLAKVRTLLDTRDMKPQDSEDPSTRHRMHSHQPAFNLALKLGRVEIAEFLLDHGHYVTPGAIVATSSGIPGESGWSFKSYDLLLRTGWNINESLGHIGDALILAVGADKFPLVKYLLENGADPNANLRGGIQSALEVAASSSGLDIINALIKSGATVKGRSALWVAAREGREDILHALLDAGAEVNAAPDNEDVYDNMRQMDDWGTALHAAAGSGRSNIVSLLLERGAPKHVRNAKGLVPEQVAGSRGHLECAELLRF